MYVCICNAVKDSEVKAVIAEGVQDVDEVYRALDVEPQCGTCRSFIRELMSEVPSGVKPDIAA
ncbi:MAG: (2Fe-2S)-binding protein [Alphaproteobacteria bacterium]|nr:(2Fe-2S)-binding protein [Alphaproteobacteria bacterium]